MKTLLRLFAVVCVLLGACGVVFGQVRTYQFSQDNAVSLISRTVSDTQLGSGTTLDEQVYSNQNLGFTFTFNGVQYTSVTIGVNGWISFGGTPNNRITPFNFETLGAQAVIGILAGDLRGRAETTIFTRTGSTNGVREFIVQWSNIQHKTNSTTLSSASYSFEITLRENGIISFEYGTFRVDPSVPIMRPSVGLRSSLSSDFNLRNGFAWSNTLMAGSIQDIVGVGSPTWWSAPNNLRMLWTPLQLTPIRPQTPTLVSPINGISANGNIDLSWNPVAGVQTYRIRIFTANNTFSQNILVNNSTSKRIVATEYNLGSFNWQVQTVQTVNGQELTSSWSDSRSFTLTLTPRILSASPVAGQQGQTVQMDIVGVNSNFNQTQTVRLQQGNFSINGVIGQRTATTLRVSFAIPANAPIGAYSLFINNVPSPLTAAFFVNAAPPPSPTPMTSNEVKSDFDPEEHGWGFGNDNFWNESAWRNLDYTNRTYPSEVRKLAPTINTLFKNSANGDNLEPMNFPSWEDFFASIRRYNTSFPLGQINAHAELWIQYKDFWNGSCYGMTTTAMFYYVARTNPSSLYTIYNFATKPAQNTTLTETFRKLINRHQAYQDRASTQFVIPQADRDFWSNQVFEDKITPQKTVEFIKDRFSKARDKQVQVSIGIVENGNPSGHALVPYRIVSSTDASGNKVDNVFVYDPNFPKDKTKFIQVVTNTRTGG
jgi:hypothetical protein